MLLLSAKDRVAVRGDDDGGDCVQKHGGRDVLGRPPVVHRAERNHSVYLSPRARLLPLGHSHMNV